MVNIMRRRQLPEIRSLREEMDRLFGDTLRAFERGFEEGTMGWSPSVDLEETENDFVITAELPGINKDDVKISISENKVLLAGEAHEEKDVQEKNYYLKERIKGRFSRGFTLPTAVDSNRAEATFKDGILKLVLPKAEEAKPKEIEIKQE